MAVPDWAVKPDPKYREIPGEYVADTTARNWQQLKLQGELWTNVFIGKVAIAFGGINIFGWKPLDFLVDWGQKRIDDALANYEAAMIAQNSANYANSQITILTGGTLASNVTGGVSLNSQFDGASANDPGASFILGATEDPGAGNWGLTGTGRCGWKKSGGATRQKFYLHTTPLATDYQVVYGIVAAKPEKTPFLGSDALLYLIARGAADGSRFAYAAIGWDNIRIGKYTGSFDQWDSLPITVNLGDQFAFIAGTSTSADQFVIKQNGMTRLAVTKSYGTGYYYVGHGAKATAKALFTDQVLPGELEMWAAADRQPATI